MKKQIIIFLACALALAGYLHFIARLQRSRLLGASFPPPGQPVSASGTTWQLGAVIFDGTNMPAGQVQFRLLADTHAPLVYEHPQFGLTFSLPAGWRGFSILTQHWEGKTYLAEADASTVTARGPLLILRHPQWKADDRYQDLPIMVFTRPQFDALHEGKFTIGAGGVEMEISHNTRFAFAISSRLQCG